jgi:hypothetical protein
LEAGRDLENPGFEPFNHKPADSLLNVTLQTASLEYNKSLSELLPKVEIGWTVPHPGPRLESRAYEQ